MDRRILKQADVAYYEDPTDPELQELLAKSEHGGCTILISVAERSESMIPTLQRLCNDRNIGMSGAIFPGLIIQGEIRYQGFSVYCYGGEIPSLLIENVDSNPERSVESLVGFVEDNSVVGKEMTLNIYIDGGLRNVASLLDSLYLEIGDDVRYFGSGCGSETNAAMACVFDNEKIVKQALLAMLLPLSEDPILEHSYKSKDIVLAIGDVEYNEIKSIDWKPAFEAYQSLVNSEFGNDLQFDKGNLFAEAVHFPFGISRLDGENIVRIPTMVGDNDNISCAGEIPQNSIITLMEPVQPYSEETIDAIAARMNLGKRDVIMVYYCVGRLAHLKVAGVAEIQQLAKKFEPALLYGALSTGEIGSSKKGGYPLLQNATILCNAIG